ncbi:Fungal transcriptional regulatory protein [Metarhizium robertsii ARSEF 23]|uniref:Fungal transcriptional regulatory protein n=1 Tax=Metarhizium robertsii (strain ARSEF 23 / ATCC MYA-3075) TaxID=655844 RepID=A0A0B2XFM2_METRA|nr:Fungal transcriptional regulatory protein [Metarhizium robertsii ARSEF 23]KHO10721.1 Fungal transcriptional regulatory protein [Metarhizium robertsii ARSEF 23]
MAFERPLHVSQNIIIPLGVLMIIFATFTFTGTPVAAIFGQKPPLFTTSRLPETGEHFLDFRHKTVPAWIYKGLHAAPAILWSILMPLQHNNSFRKKYPKFHRSAGYIIITFSFILSLSGYWFLVSKHAYSHVNRYHLHDLDGLSPIPWPTFELTLWLLAPPYYFTLYKTATTARARDFVQHQKWAVLHTIVSSTISLQRVTMTASYGLGLVLMLVSREQVHEFFKVQDLASAAAAELDMFALTTATAYVMMVFWLLYQLRCAGYFRGVTNNLFSVVDQETAAKKVA